MPIPIRMPALSPTMSEGNLVKWHKKRGDSVFSGDMLAEIETDKAIMEVEAVDEGILGEVVVQEGAEGVAVNQVIAWLLEEGETAESIPANIGITSHAPQESSPKKHPPLHVVENGQETPGPSLVSSQPSKRIAASPLAKRNAHLHQVDLSLLQGSGPHGRIVNRDVEKALQNLPPPPLPQDLSFQKIHPGEGLDEFSGHEPAYDLVPLSSMRQTIAKRLTLSKQTIPHFYLSIDCQIDALLGLRHKLNAVSSEKISINDMIVRACAIALYKVPQMNVAWSSQGLRRYHDIDISIAVAIDGGLITPVVRKAYGKTLQDISKEAKDLYEKARQGALKPEQFQGGTFSLSNLGMHGITSFYAILNPPQACILSIGSGEKRAIVQEGNVVSPATMLTLSLSLDHRAIDGAVGASFLSVLKEHIEFPHHIIV